MAVSTVATWLFWSAWPWLLVSQCLANGETQRPLPKSPAAEASARDADSARTDESITKLERQLDRLQGHTVTRIESSGALTGFRIDDVAEEGRPLVGWVRTRGDELILTATDGRTYRLLGPLARKRIAGPGYKVWVLGEIRLSAATVAASNRSEPAAPRLAGSVSIHRIGILASPEAPIPTRQQR